MVEIIDEPYRSHTFYSDRMFILRIIFQVNGREIKGITQITTAAVRTIYIDKFIIQEGRGGEAGFNLLK